MNSNDVDIFIHVTADIETLDRTLEALFKWTRIPYRLVLVVDTPSPEIRAYVKEWIASHLDGKPAIVVANKISQGFTESLRIGLETANKAGRREYFIVLHERCQLMQKGWEDLLTTPFKDRNCFLTFVDPTSVVSQQRPAPIPRTRYPLHGLLAMRRPAPHDIPKEDHNSPWMHLAGRGIQEGRRIYVVPSIRIAMPRLPDPPRKVKAGDPSSEVLLSR